MPSPGRTVTGEIPDLDGAKRYTGNGVAPLASRIDGRECIVILERGQGGMLFLAVHSPHALSRGGEN